MTMSVQARNTHATKVGLPGEIKPSHSSTVLDPKAFGMRRMPPSDYDPAGLTSDEKAVIQAYADTL